MAIAAEPVVRAALASLYAELGDSSGCRAALRALSAEGFTAIPFDDLWVMTVARHEVVAARCEVATTAA